MGFGLSTIEERHRALQFTVRDENGGLLSKVNGAPAAEITRWWGQEQKLRAERFRNISLAQATPNEDGSFTLLEVPLNS